MDHFYGFSMTSVFVDHSLTVTTRNSLWNSLMYNPHFTLITSPHYTLKNRKKTVPSGSDTDSGLLNGFVLVFSYLFSSAYDTVYMC